MQFSLGPRLAPLTHPDFTAILDLGEALQTEASPWYRLTVQVTIWSLFRDINATLGAVPGRAAGGRPRNAAAPTSRTAGVSRHLPGVLSIPPR
ncbi:Zinc Finger And Btb Domain-Containing Protein 16 [Manis pentadactyla]|nr:Zinc Finger And Btb Domain-Containing Protein 16 [Manis pentadactyla]